MQNSKVELVIDDKERDREKILMRKEKSNRREKKRYINKGY